VKRLIVTLDGPAGAGKTTVSRMLAARLGYRYIDTGALYRGVAVEARRAGIGPDDDTGLETLCPRLGLKPVFTQSGLRLLSDGVDITEAIRTPEISLLASAVSARPVVRAYLLELQRDLGKDKNIVIEGRDMGTVVFPDAEVKFFLKASPEARAARRYLELKDTSGQDLETVKREMLRRDRNDSTRAVAPLTPAPDAVHVDSTDLSVEQVVERMLAVVEQARRSGCESPPEPPAIR